MISIVGSGTPLAAIPLTVADAGGLPHDYRIRKRTGLALPPPEAAHGRILRMQNFR